MQLRSSANVLKRIKFRVAIINDMMTRGESHELLPHISRSAKLAFGPFQFDPESRELRKHGYKVKLASQPAQVLRALLEDPGEVLARETLRNRLWPGATAGDFEHGLNAAVNKLRQALGDCASQPRYVETLP